MAKETSPKLDPIPPFEINIDRDILWRVGTALGECKIDGLKTNEIQHIVELIAQIDKALSNPIWSQVRRSAPWEV